MAVDGNGGDPGPDTLRFDRPLLFAASHLTEQRRQLRHLDTMSTALLGLYGVFAAIVLRSIGPTPGRSTYILVALAILFTASVLLLYGLLAVQGQGRLWPAEGKQWWRTVILSAFALDQNRLLFGTEKERGLLGQIEHNNRQLVAKQRALIWSVVSFIASWIMVAIATFI